MFILFSVVCLKITFVAFGVQGEPKKKCKLWGLCQSNQVLEPVFLESPTYFLLYELFPYVCYFGRYFAIKICVFLKKRLKTLTVHISAVFWGTKTENQSKNNIFYPLFSGVFQNSMGGLWHTGWAKIMKVFGVGLPCM